MTLAAGVLGWACIKRVDLPFDPVLHHRPAVPAPAELVALYDYPAGEVTAELERIPRRGNGSHRVYRFSMPSAGHNGQPGRLVTGRYIQSRNEGRKRLVVVLPVYGSSLYPPHKLTTHLVTHDSDGQTNVLLLRGEQRIFDWPALGELTTEEALWEEVDRSVDHFRTTVVDLRRVLDWAVTQPDVDPERIGIVGFSIGALLAGVTLGVEERYAAGVLVMGGGHLNQAFSLCEGQAGASREKLLRRFGWSPERFADLLKEPLATIDPLRYARAVDPERVLVFEGTRDACFPEQAREDLWEALGRPERVLLFGNHRRAFLAMTTFNRNYATRRIGGFLEEKL